MAGPALRNIWLKFLSISIATMLWLVVAGDRVVERALQVPIEFQNLPAALEITGATVETVDVRVRASSGTLGRLAPGDMAAVIDLRSARPGRRLFHLAPAAIKAPYGVEVVQVSPATLPMAFEHSAIRIVQVRPSVEGRPAPGYEVASVVSRPATVEVVGPESALRGLDEAMTEPISVADATRPVREVVTVGVADPSVRLRTPQTAEVVVQVVPGASTRTVAGVAVTAHNLEAGLRARITPATVSVSVRGTAEAIKALTPEAIEAHVDAAGLTPGDHSAGVQARTIPGVRVEALSPASVRVRVSKP